MKTFLSIGSGAGVGFATAERFAREGFQVILSARTADKTKLLAEQLTVRGYKAEARTVDAGDPMSIDSLLEDVEKQFGAIDVLHYNAASMRKATLMEQPRETFNSDLAINVGGALIAAQRAARTMKERGSGTILLTGGGFALEPNPDYLSLSVGKAAIRALTFGLFERLKAEGIHVATVTVMASVLPSSRDAERVAQEFWQIYNQPQGSWTAELAYSVRT